MGVEVIVGVLVMVAVGVNVGVDVSVGRGVSVNVAVQAAAVMVACSSGKGLHAVSRMAILRMSVIFFIIKALCYLIMCFKTHHTLRADDRAMYDFCWQLQSIAGMQGQVLIFVGQDEGDRATYNIDCFLVGVYMW